MLKIISAIATFLHVSTGLVINDPVHLNDQVNKREIYQNKSKQNKAPLSWIISVQLSSKQLNSVSAGFVSN